MKNNQSEITKKIFNRIYYLLNKSKYKKKKYRFGVKRFTNRAYTGTLQIYHGEFLITFD